MRAVFVDNVLMEHRAAGLHFELQPHLGLISLIATLRALGHVAELYDPKIGLHTGELILGPRFYEAAAEQIAARRPEVVGFTSLGCNFIFTLKIAAAFRRMHPSVPILLGGPHASIVDREILERHTEFDIIARGEAEATIGPLFAALSGAHAFGEVSGLSYRRDGHVVRTPDAGPILDLDRLPMSAYDAYPIDELGLQTLDVDAGRGCPFHCAFCSTATFFGRKFRLKSADRLVAELDALAQRYGVRQFNLSHDLFTVNKKSVQAFCRAVSGRAYGWTCSARMDCVDESLLGEMAAAGCNAIYYGVETGSARLQSLMRKRLDLDLYHPTVRASRGLGMNTVVSFMTGFPHETDEDLDATLDLIGQTMDEHHAGLTVQLHLLAPEPGTALHAQYADSLAFDGHTSDFNVPFLEPLDQQIVKAEPDIFICHHYYAVGERRRDDIAITGAFRTLSRLGHALFTALARTFGGTFANMLRAFSITRARAPSEDAALIEFVREHWGALHPYVDVARYVVALEQRCDVALPDGSAGSHPAGIRLAPNVVPLADCYDGAELLRLLHTGIDPAGNPRDRSDRLLFAAPGTPQGGKLFAVDPTTFALASALVRPTTYARLRADFDREELDRRLWVLELMNAIVGRQRESSSSSGSDSGG